MLVEMEDWKVGLEVELLRKNRSRMRFGSFNLVEGALRFFSLLSNPHR